MFRKRKVWIDSHLDARAVIEDGEVYFNATDLTVILREVGEHMSKEQRAVYREVADALVRGRLNILAETLGT